MLKYKNMQNENYPLTAQEFKEIYSKVPRLCVEVILKNEKGVLLTLRSIEPYKDVWHFPGGTVYFHETAQDAVKRIAKKELGIDVNSATFVTYIEYPSYSQVEGWPVSLAFVVEEYNGDIVLNDEASEANWFTTPPENTHPMHGELLERLTTS